MKKIFNYALLAIALLSSCEKDEQDTGTQSYALSDESLLMWEGRKPGTANYGSLDVTSTEGILVKNGKVTGGSFSFPLSTINVMNMTGEPKGQLEDHLKTSDFFNAALYPTVKFDIKTIKAYTGGVAEGVTEGANYTVTGDLTILGLSKEISFPAKISITNNKITVAAELEINRFNWGMNYASNPDEPLHYIYPEIAIDFILEGNRK